VGPHGTHTRWYGNPVPVGVGVGAGHPNFAHGWPVFITNSIYCSNRPSKLETFYFFYLAKFCFYFFFPSRTWSSIIVLGTKREVEHCRSHLSFLYCVRLYAVVLHGAGPQKNVLTLGLLVRTYHDITWTYPRDISRTLYSSRHRTSILSCYLFPTLRMYVIFSSLFHHYIY
jgi:hypothetical protein